jgi:hypothetical protein
VVQELFMNRNIAGNGKINQDLTFAEKGRTYHGISQNEERRKKEDENVFIVQACRLYPM